MQTGWQQTAPPSPGTYTITLASGQNIGNRNFGNKKLDSKPGSICGTKFNDLNGNGVWNAGEPRLPNWTINLTGASTLSVTTDEKGNYCFTDLPAGTYTVSEVMQTGWQQTAPPSPGTYTITLASGQNIVNRNFGNKLVCNKAWTALGSGMNAAVYAIAVMGGELYAGGNFTTAGGVSANKIAKWNGTNWTALGSGMNNSVNAIAVMGGELYAGGAFTTAGGVSANKIAKWNGTNWTALGSGVNNHVYAFEVMGGELYAGGEISTAGGVSANHVAKWNGTNWTALGSGINGYVRGFAVMGGELYAGGQFSTAGGVSAMHVAKWNDTNWTALGSGMNQAVWPLAVMGGELYAGGQFTTAGGVSANHVAKWGCP